MSAGAWAWLCGGHRQQCSQCRSAWTGSGARRQLAGRAADGASPVMNRTTRNDKEVH